MMPVIEIIRLEESAEHGTFGVLKINKEVFCMTLEPADRLNRCGVSSIPAQQYRCERVVSPKYGNVFEVKRVPGRSHVLFHAGNVAGHTRGCILLGQHFGKLRGNRAVLNSGNTFKAFMGRLAGVDMFHLTIREVF